VLDNHILLFSDKNDLGSLQRSLRSLTPEISDDDEDPYAIESLVVHGTLDAGLSILFF
jgi:hypothetical protein